MLSPWCFVKVAQEGHDQNFYIFLLVYLWSKYFFLPNFQERELGLTIVLCATFMKMATLGSNGRGYCFEL